MTHGTIGHYQCGKEPLFGKYVAIYMLTSNTALQLCEVEVYSFTCKNYSAAGLDLTSWSVETCRNDVIKQASLLLLLSRTDEISPLTMK